MRENKERLLELIRPLLPDDKSYGRLHADLHDLEDICQKFLQFVGAENVGKLSRDDLEGFLIDLDIEIDHSLFHLNSAKKEIASALDKLTEADDADTERSKVG